MITVFWKSPYNLFKGQMMTNNNNIYLKSNINVYNIRVQWTVHNMGLYNLKQYDHNQILNELVHITLLHTINICAE